MKGREEKRKIGCVVSDAGEASGWHARLLAGISGVGEDPLCVVVDGVVHRGEGGVLWAAGIPHEAEIQRARAERLLGHGGLREGGGYYLRCVARVSTEISAGVI